jgi:PTS system nitrogen regulatory IIA component
MIPLSEILTPESVTAELTSTSKADVLRELARLVVSGQPSVERSFQADEVARMLVARESLAATGIGNGIAIPHAASDRVRRLYGAFGRSREGIDFGGVDGAPCTFFFALLTPSSRPKLHIRALSRLSRVLGEPETRSALLEAPSAADIFAVLMESDDRIQQATSPR